MMGWKVTSIGWIGICVFIGKLSLNKGTLLPEKPAKESGCFGINGDVYLSTNCTDDNNVMAIEDVRYGAKSLADVCNSTDSSCCMASSGDCSFRYRLDEEQAFCSGKKSCISPIRVSQNTIQNATCDTSIYGTLTQFIYMDYYCIPRQRIFDVTNGTSAAVSGGMFAYLWNNNYGKNNTTINVIQASDMYVSCSVQTGSCNSRIRVFSVHVKLMDPNAICGQNMTFFYDNGQKYSINCSPRNIGLLFESTTPYVRFEVHNSLSEHGGRFWLGFQASESTGAIYLNCPAENQTTYTCETVTTKGNVSESLVTTAGNVDKNLSQALIIGLVIAAVLVILFMILAFIIWRKCKKTNKDERLITSQDDIIDALFAGSLASKIYKSVPPRKTAMWGQYEKEKDDYHIKPTINIFPDVPNGKNRLTPIMLERATNIQEDGQHHRKRKHRKKLKRKKKINKNKVSPDHKMDTPNNNAKF
ncbi:hypothetical protein CHS0354_010192 [Potamilus streckersoni]|uniref:Uncharacterized protein n=1 Tax=Potamilus streckersoni TaxID=2493646 RepID=A0AAE0RSM0_9BIVA|nr:hypothetical protein CHS0354_010192 [Potamilus streckersoni]